MKDYDKHGHRRTPRPRWRDSLAFWAVVGGLVGAGLATMCCWPWVAETVKLIKGIVEHW